MVACFCCIRRGLFLHIMEKHTYHLENIALDVELFYSHCEGDRDTPPCTDAWVDKITHKGRETSLEATARLMATLYGCHITEEEAERMIIEDWHETMQNSHEGEMEGRL